MKISNAISEIKRKVVPVHDEMQLLQDMVEQIKVKTVQTDTLVDGRGDFSGETLVDLHFNLIKYGITEA